MFEIGSSSPNPKLVHLMERIAKSLKDQPGAIVLRGYTDARRYSNGSSDNWRLSASRAQMALYMLARGGLPESRIERVEGYADRHLKVPQTSRTRPKTAGSKSCCAKPRHEIPRMKIPGMKIPRINIPRVKIPPSRFRSNGRQIRFAGPREHSLAALSRGWRGALSLVLPHWAGS